MPNTSSRVLQGIDSGHSAGTTIEAGLPNIEGGFSLAIGVGSRNDASFTGPFYGSGSSSYSPNYGTSQKSFSYNNFNASRSSSVYGNSTTVQPPALSTNFCIKY